MSLVSFSIEHIEKYGLHCTLQSKQIKSKKVSEAEFLELTFISIEKFLTRRESLNPK